MTTIRAATAEELYADGEGQDGDTAGGWTLVGNVEDRPQSRTSRWHERYWLVIRNEQGDIYGLEYGIGLTEDQEDLLPWDPGYGTPDPDKVLPLTRLYPHTITRVEYRSAPAEVSA